MRKRLYILSFLLLCSNFLFAQSKFTVQVSSRQVATGEEFQVDFTAQGTNVSDFHAPNFAGFRVLSGPNPSQSYSNYNGVVTNSTGFSYILMAVRQGTFTIGPATITIDSKQARTNPVQISVVKGQPVQQQTQQQGQPQSGGVSSVKDLQRSVFLVPDIDKTKVYPGEQLILTYKLYFNVNILGWSGQKIPELNGFWNTDITSKKQLTDKDVKIGVYKGKRMQYVVVKQDILFAEHAGDVVIDPFVLNVGVRYQEHSNSDDIFDQVFGGETKETTIQVKTQPVTIHAMPLPEAGKPANFNGAVGEFSVDETLDKKELKANESLNYNLKISGKGNLGFLSAPVITPPADFEKYDPKVTDNITANETGTSGSREYTYLMIPRHQGDFTFTSPGFSYFNPATRRYVTIPAKNYPIKVNKGDAVASTSVFNAQQDVKVLGKDICYIKTTSPDLYSDGDGFYGSPGFWFLLFLGPLAFAGAFLYRKWNEDQNSDTIKLKSRQANKIAAKHLANASQMLSAGDKKAFYEAIAKGLYGYLSDKLNIPVADLNKENITGQLQIKGLNSATINQLADTIDLCEMARFAPVTGISDQQVFDKAKNTINEIEDKI